MPTARLVAITSCQHQEGGYPGGEYDWGMDILGLGEYVWEGRWVCPAVSMSPLDMEPGIPHPPNEQTHAC